MKQTEKQFLKTYDPNQFKRPNATVDIVIYTIIESQLHTLVVKRHEHPYKDDWALAGGFIDIEQDKTLEETALRRLYEKTAVKSPYLEQFGAVGNQDRDPRYWSISTVYFALLPYNDVKSELLHCTQSTKWLPIKNGKVQEKLAFDHNTLLKNCTERLQSKALYTTLPLYLFKKYFTLKEAREVYEVILEQKLEAKTFRRRMLGADILTEAGKIQLHCDHRPAMQYKLKSKKTYFFRVLLLS